jgi:hypothetical protein
MILSRLGMHKDIQIIRRILDDVQTVNGQVALAEFNSLRDVDAKVRELRLIIERLPESASLLKQSFEKDEDFKANSRRVRLEALANYCRTILRFLENGIIEPAKVIMKSPDLTGLTVVNPALETIIQNRWREAQICQNAGAYLAAVILMGSLIEALLLCRAMKSIPKAMLANKAPKDKTGQVKKIQDWNLNALIEVAVELGWLKVDRGKFSHALRESRNVVHPWQHATIQADFDEATCKTCWHVVNASVDDLLRSVIGQP